MDVVGHQRATEDEKRELLKLIKRMHDMDNEDSGNPCIPIPHDILM